MNQDVLAHDLIVFRDLTLILSLFIDYINILYLERSISRNCELYIPKSWDQG